MDPLLFFANLLSFSLSKVVSRSSRARPSPKSKINRKKLLLSLNICIASPHPNHVLDLFEGMFSGNRPSPRVGESNVKDRGRGSIARKCLPARTEKFNPKNDLGVT